MQHPGKHISPFVITFCVKPVVYLRKVLPLKLCSYLSFRFNYEPVQESLHYSHHEALSSHSSPFKSASRQPRDARSMPPTPLLTRNALSSTQLR